MYMVLSRYHLIAEGRTAVSTRLSAIRAVRAEMKWGVMHNKCDAADRLGAAVIGYPNGHVWDGLAR
jgi:hypothetical protein